MELRSMNFLKLQSNAFKTIVSILFISFCVVFVNKALLANVVYESDDYLHHAARTANYYLALQQGQFPVRWAPNLNESYGYPSFNYMYHTPYMVGSVFHFLGLSIQQSLNLSVLFSLLIAAVGCWLLLNSYKLSSLWKVLLSLFFVLNPYTLLSVYWRGAIGELYFYAFVPLFLLCVRKLLQSKLFKQTWKLYFIALVISTGLLVLSHLPSMILLAPLLLTVLYTEHSETRSLKIYISLIVAGILGLLLSSWYWVPAYFEQWMIVYQDGTSLLQHTNQFSSLIAILDIRRNFLSSEFFSGVINVGGVSLLAIIFGLANSFFTKKILPWLSLLLLALFFMLNYSENVWDSVTLLQYVQYPWRMLWVITICTLFIWILLLREKKISHLYKKIAFGVITFSVLFSVQGYVATKGSTTRSDFEWYHTFATGSSFDEHRPIWSKQPYYFPEELIFVYASESATISKENNRKLIHSFSELHPSITSFSGTTMQYGIEPEQDIIVLHKRLFYPGWEAFLDEEKVDFIKNIPQYEGILAVAVPNRRASLVITFTGATTLRRVAEYISLLTLIGLATFLLYPLKRN